MILGISNFCKGFFVEWQEVGSDRSYHYCGSEIWNGRVGKKGGEEMLKLIK
jgi:hypothetical protein|tara:strand:+ start:5334 stop:5486 length:153 start_codon:yes stop_codon:yes gene_type:complete